PGCTARSRPWRPSLVNSECSISRAASRRNQRSWLRQCGHTCEVPLMIWNEAAMRNSDSGCILSGVDAQLVNAIANHLKKMGVSASVCKFDSRQPRLRPKRDGLLILAAASTAEAREVSRRVQEITLQQWPVAVLVATTGAASGELNCLHGHVSGLFHWPR